MKFISKSLVTALAFSVALALAPTSASAFVPFHPIFKPWWPPKKPPHKFPHKIHHAQKDPGKPHLKHGLSAVQWYVTGSVFCSAAWLIGHAAYVSRTEHRELTYREAYTDVAGCFLPIIGPLLVAQYLPRNY
jgi:hypothetical protein